MAPERDGPTLMIAAAVVGFPRLQFSPGRYIPAGVDAWSHFVAVGTDADRALVLAVLERSA